MIFGRIYFQVNIGNKKEIRQAISQKIVTGMKL